MDSYGAVTSGRSSRSKPAPVSMKVGAVKFSDLSGPTNPKGILSPAFLFLKQALDDGGTPEQVTQALYGWLADKGQRAIKPQEVDKLLRLKPELALDRLVQMVGVGLRKESLPPAVLSTLRQVLSYIAGRYTARQEPRLQRQQARLSGIKRRYGVESAAQIVAHLLD